MLLRKTVNIAYIQRKYGVMAENEKNIYRICTNLFTKKIFLLTFTQKPYIINI